MCDAAVLLVQVQCNLLTISPQLGYLALFIKVNSIPTLNYRIIESLYPNYPDFFYKYLHDNLYQNDS